MYKRVVFLCHISAFITIFVRMTPVYIPFLFLIWICFMITLSTMETSNVLLNSSALLKRPMRFVKEGPGKRGFSYYEEMELLRLHNFYRSNVSPPAGNMMAMEWDPNLAVTAQDWADNCKFAHGFLPNSYPDTMGQNLYIGPERTGVEAASLWNEEYVDYNFKSNSCPANKQCGHYTQIVWAGSRRLGCGITECDSFRFLVVCHYSPAGNVIGVRPYTVGKPCSSCNTISGGLCANNLCVTSAQCERNPDICESAACTLNCHNCGILDAQSCRCFCLPGWDSLDCSIRCQDQHEKCGKNPGWPTKDTCSMNHFAVKDKYCRKMCDQCVGIENHSSNKGGTNLCCKGKLCPHGYVLDFNCECSLLCPGPLCYENSACKKLHVHNKIILVFAIIVLFSYHS